MPTLQAKVRSPGRHTLCWRPPQPQHQGLQADSNVRNRQTSKRLLQLQILEQMCHTISATQLLVAQIASDRPSTTSELADDSGSQQMTFASRVLFECKSNPSATIVPRAWLTVPSTTEVPGVTALRSHTPSEHQGARSEGRARSCRSQAPPPQRAGGRRRCPS